MHATRLTVGRKDTKNLINESARRHRCSVQKHHRDGRKLSAPTNHHYYCLHSHPYCPHHTRRKALAHPLSTWHQGQRRIRLHAVDSAQLKYPRSFSRRVQNRSTPDHSSSVLLTARVSGMCISRHPVIERHFSLSPHSQPDVSRFRMDDGAVANHCTAMLRRDIERLSRCNHRERLGNCRFNVRPNSTVQRRNTTHVQLGTEHHRSAPFVKSDNEVLLKAHGTAAAPCCRKFTKPHTSELKVRTDGNASRRLNPLKSQHDLAQG